MTLYTFLIFATAIFFAITAIRIYKDRQKGITKRESVLEYFHPLHEATGTGGLFSILLVIIVWWTIIKILWKAWNIVWEWIN